MLAQPPRLQSSLNKPLLNGESTFAHPLKLLQIMEYPLLLDLVFGQAVGIAVASLD